MVLVGGYGENLCYFDRVMFGGNVSRRLDV